MGRFSNLLIYLLFDVCLFLAFSQVSVFFVMDLRQKLGVTIQHLIGSDMEPLLLGCGDSTKIHPKVTKPLSSVQDQDSFFLRTM